MERTDPPGPAPRPVRAECGRSVACLWSLGGSFVEDVLHPVDALERMQRVAAESKRDGPRTGDDEIQLRVICPNLGSVGEAVPRLGLRPTRRPLLDGLAGEELAYPVLDRLARLAIHDLDDVVDVLPSVRR